MALLEVKNLHTYFKTRKGTVKAVNDVSYSLEAGKTIGIVGESGSGKSVSAMSILQLLDGNGYIAEGEVIFEGRDLTKLSQQDMYEIRGNKISVIFQEPMTSLNPVFTVKRQLSEPFMIHQGMNKKEAEEKALEMLAAVQIPNPEAVLRQYPHQLSGGMRQRVMIAMMLSREPELLIADEPTTALDVTIEAQILEIIKDLKHTHNTAIMMITHNFGLVAEVADKVAVMYAGELIEYADVFEIFENPQHPYTKLLMKALPRGTKKEGRLQIIDGSVPRILDKKPGCRFANRCPYAQERCFNETPQEVEVADDHTCRCFLAEAKKEV